MTDTEAYIKDLVDTNPLREPLLRSMIESLRLSEGSRGLDAGCGVGLQSLLLAEAVGPAGHVVGLDQSPAFLRYGSEVAKASDLSSRISFHEGDVGKLPFDDKTFDWVWSADCVGYPTGNLLPALRELARVVKPGGMVAILALSSQSLLPGYPLLEARLNATCSELIPYVEGRRPESQFLRALGRFREAGLENAKGATFVSDIQPPLKDDMRGALVSLFRMLWGTQRPEVSREDWAECQRLCRPESPEFILNLSDYYAFFTYSMFRGIVPL